MNLQENKHKRSPVQVQIIFSYWLSPFNMIIIILMTYLFSLTPGQMRPSDTMKQTGFTFADLTTFSTRPLKVVQDDEVNCAYKQGRYEKTLLIPSQHLAAGWSIASEHPAADAPQPTDSLNSASFYIYMHALHNTDWTVSWSSIMTSLTFT